MMNSRVVWFLQSRKAWKPPSVPTDTRMKTQYTARAHAKGHLRPARRRRA